MPAATNVSATIANTVIYLLFIDWSVEKRIRPRDSFGSTLPAASNAPDERRGTAGNRCGKGALRKTGKQSN
jgi:hypothetical protein